MDSLHSCQVQILEASSFPDKCSKNSAWSDTQIDITGLQLLSNTKYTGYCGGISQVRVGHPTPSYLCNNDMKMEKWTGSTSPASPLIRQNIKDYWCNKKL